MSTEDELNRESRDSSPSRRRLLGGIAAAMAGGIGALLAWPPLAFLLTPGPRVSDDPWRPVGQAADFPLGQTRTARYLRQDALPWDGLSQFSAVMIRRTGPDQFLAFSPYCTHVGCPVRWDSGARLFLCPCHGGAYYEDGSVAAGPPPHPLLRHQVRLVGGVVEIRARPIRLSG